MRNAGLDEAQAGIKVARRNINNLRYAEDTTFMAESEEELKSLLIKDSSVHFIHSVVSDSAGPHESQHARPPCPSPTPGVHSDSRPSSQWCHPAISTSVVPFSSCPQSLPASESFPISQLFTCTWAGQYWSFSFSISPSKEIPWLISFRMDWLDRLAVQGTLKSLLQHYSSKASILWRSVFFTVQLSHPYMLLLLSRFSRVRLCATP